jgi:hypothetical protein
VPLREAGVKCPRDEKTLPEPFLIPMAPTEEAVATIVLPAAATQQTPKIEPVVRIGSVQFETKDGFFPAASLVLKNEALLEMVVEGTLRLELKLSTVTIASASTLSYARGCKLVLECKATSWHRVGILKLWFRRLSDVEAVMDSISESTQGKVRMSGTAIPKLLHTPALLRFYSPALRRLVSVVDHSLTVVAYLSFLLYATNILALFPLDFFDAVLAWVVWLYNALQSTPLLVIPFCLLAPFVLPMLGLLPVVALAVHLAQRYLHALLSLQLLYDMQRLLSTVSKVRSFINRVRGVKRTLKRSKAKKVE